MGAFANARPEAGPSAANGIKQARKGLRTRGPAQTGRSKRWVLIRVRPRTKRVPAGVSSTTATRSTALPARSSSFDDIDGSPECRVYIQMRGIEQVCVGGRLERCGGAPGIALVAASDVGEDGGLIDALAGGRQLQAPPAGPDLRG